MRRSNSCRSRRSPAPCPSRPRPRARSPRDARRGSASRLRRSCRTAPARCCPRRSAIRRTRECVFGDTAAGKWRHQRRNRAEKHELASCERSFRVDSWAGVHWPDKERRRKMSSMWRAAVILPVAAGHRAVELGAICAAPRLCLPTATRLCAERRYALDDWRTLRQSSGYSFADYARFLIANPRLAGRSEDARAGPKGDAAGRECRHGHRLLRQRQAEHRQRLGAACRRLCRERADGRGARRGAEGLGVADLSATDEQSDLGPLRRQLHARRP